MTKMNLLITQFIGIGFALIISVSVYGLVSWALAALLGITSTAGLIILTSFVCTFHMAWTYYGKLPEQKDILPKDAGDIGNDDDFGTP